MNKPITVARHDYTQEIVRITNNSGLPAFIKVDVLRDVLSKLEPMMEEELKRDTAQYRAALQKESEGVVSDGGQEDK